MSIVILHVDVDRPLRDIHPTPNVKVSNFRTEFGRLADVHLMAGIGQLLRDDEMLRRKPIHHAQREGSR